MVMALALAAARAQDEGTCGDGAVIFELPAKLAAARKQASKGWESGVTSEMVEASAAYNAALCGMITELGNTYYAKPPTKAQVAAFQKALADAEIFGQMADNPRGEPEGTIKRVELASAVSAGLGDMIVRMVQALLQDDSRYSFAEWKESWDKVWEEDE